MQGRDRHLRPRGDPSGEQGVWVIGEGGEGGLGGCVGSMESDAYRASVANLQQVLSEFREAEGGEWIAPRVRGACVALRLAAQASDEAARRRGESGVSMDDAGRQLQKVFTAAMQGGAGKRGAALHTITQLFKIYFRLNTLRLCKNLVKAFEGQQGVQPSAGGGRGVDGAYATYKFYVGRLAMFEERFGEADGDLTQSLMHCLPGHASNAARVLRYLIPVKLMAGKVPKVKFLNRYGLSNEYGTLSRSVRLGHVEQFNADLRSQARVYIRRGNYLTLERLRLMVYRNLLRHVHHVHKQVVGEGSATSFQVPLVLFSIALDFVGGSLPAEELECIVAGLIYSRFVKGYISHSKQTLVLSKINPFPHMG